MNRTLRCTVCRSRIAHDTWAHLYRRQTAYGVETVLICDRHDIDAIADDIAESHPDQQTLDDSTDE
jgi:hypothetical protein